jgi:pyrimidine operon attenuation protein/uracil phosphoribosyltransferase
METTIILNSKQIEQKTERIAYEIYENSFDEDILFIGGIKGNGFEFAERLIEKLIEISRESYSKGIRLFEVSVNKSNPLNHSIDLSLADSELENASIILVDDVINSGSTLLHATSRILQQNVKTIKTAILVNRTHRRFPILADYVGLDITTTLQDNIVVEFGDKECAYLV